MAKSKAKKFYAVARGKNGPAIYETWPECQKQTNGYPNARYKSFATREECVDFVRKNGQPDWQDPESASQASSNDDNLDHQLGPDSIRTRSGPSRSGNLEITRRYESLLKKIIKLWI